MTSPSETGTLEPHLATSTTVEQVRETVQARIRELRPIITELEQLQAILALLDEHPEAGAPVARIALPQPLSQPPRPLLRRGRRGVKPGRDGRRPQGANKQLILAAILEHPGITAPEIADRSGLKRTVISATIHRLKRTGELEPYGEGVRVPMGGEVA